MTIEVALATYLDTLGDAYDHSLPKTGASYPALVYQTIFEDTNPLIDGSGIEQVETVIQVRILATTKTESRTISRQITSQYSGFVGSINGVDVTNCLVTMIGEDEDKDENLKMVIMEIRFFQ